MGHPGSLPVRLQWTPNHQLHFSSLSCLTADEAEGRMETGLAGRLLAGRGELRLTAVVWNF